MIALVAIEGATGDARTDPAWAGSFIHDLFTTWPHPAVARYVPGPQPPSPGLQPYRRFHVTAAQAYNHALQLRGRGGVQGLFLAGYSLGGAAAIAVARMLKAHGIAVDCLALYDAVDGWPPVLQRGGWVPLNVRYMVHGYRDIEATNSRPLWGNCGTTSLTFTHHTRKFKITHWGASGTWLKSGIPAGVKPTDFVEEGGQPTKVTWAEDLAAAKDLQRFMQLHIDNVYADLVIRFKDPTKAPKMAPGTPPASQRPGNGATKSKDYVVQTGDSLSLIAGKFWQDVLLWPILWNTNRSKIGSNPNLITPGTLLKVPDISHLSPSERESVRQTGRTAWKG